MKVSQVGIAGEFRCVVIAMNGDVKTDTGYQKNLILNQGLDFFGGGKGSSINDYCVVGSGNTTPAVTQTSLDSYIMQSYGTGITSDYSYTDTGDGLYRMWTQKKYRFQSLSDVNISEVGLVSEGTTSSNYYLTTRALIKDSLGNPTTITVLSGETLDIYYKIHKVIDTADKSFVINVLDGSGGAVPYNAVVRPARIGISHLFSVEQPFDNWFFNQTVVNTGDLAAVTSAPSGKLEYDYTVTFAAYAAGSFKSTATLSLALNQGNIPIRSVTISSIFLSSQMRLGRVSDDAPLTKTSNDTLSIPLEFSWGRFEGVL